MKVKVLRLGHRFVRDKRTTTHIGLVARALGAQELILDSKDSKVKESLGEVVEEWGGTFKVKFSENWKKVIHNFSGDKIHLTMYGINVDEEIDKLRESGKDKLIIVGGKKVPSEVYQLADYNIAIGHQPHSEIAALAIFLDRLFQGRELEKEFEGKKKVIPQERGKKLKEE